MSMTLFDEDVRRTLGCFGDDGRVHRGVVTLRTQMPRALDLTSSINYNSISFMS